MNRLKELSDIRRLPDEGLLFGVCAGLAEFYGWRVRTVRFVVAVLALILNWPIIIAYVIAVFLLPTPEEQEDLEHRQRHAKRQSRGRRARRRSARPDDAAAKGPLYTGNLRDRYATIEKRMRRVEAYLHGSEYELRSAFRDLEHG